MKTSIIIPVRAVNSYIHESLQYIARLQEKNYEVIILPDTMPAHGIEGARIIPTGAVGPAAKRDLGARHATGEILAFLDDDAYPQSDWLDKALVYFKVPEIAAVGGPAITPRNQGIWQKASGLVLSSSIGAGSKTYRYIPGKKQFVDDFPSVNFIVRKSVFDEVGGFDTSFWPGEDTKLCHDIVQNGFKILYDPEVIVYHHRRKLFLPHLRQITRYAMHRGLFVRTYPRTSLRLGYFMPSLLVIFILFGFILSLLIPLFMPVYITVVSLYLLSVLYTALRSRNLQLGALVAWGIILTHISYGLYFMGGLFSRRLAR
jgi:GT2 family glycosyltransferase